MQDWVRNEMDKLNNRLQEQGETPDKFFGRQAMLVKKELHPPMYVIHSVITRVQ